MDFSKWPEIQQHQYQLPQTNLTPSTDPYPQLYNAPSSYQPNYSYYPHHPTNPISNQFQDIHTNPIYQNPPPPATQFDSTGLLRPPAIDPYGPNHYAPHTGYDAAPQPMPAAPAVGTSHFPAVKEAIRQFGVDPVSYGAAVGPPNAMGPIVRANPIPSLGLHHVINSAVFRRPKKNKVAQSAWCEVCKIDCNSKDVLDMHKLGKKHKRNVHKLEELKKEGNATATAVEPSKPVADKEGTSSSREKTVAGQGEKKRGAPPVEAGDDLETKRRKLMEGGAPAGSVRVCAVCNVACNSETVFKFHVEGQKHAVQVRKQAAMRMAMAAAAGHRFVTAI
ncbi:hypothetical protein MRB53_007012 [Persea americana]|uniref:Uncharacterized protein n=1 Tax=Persea americana TaxID=3435 RepID=A0ACC2MHT8_PERAE|nr:hypothetical protein MRB53_007012 [Persea americana]|eukprot:TRINITY_DN31311_c0_g1_i1.p1 TRINITY_DN31311_c0_g1~~TRINITY_DN31311_c0_g1_i1.p1  ORF type:complete len:334 (-),score=62.40 TRINITY_DN31311_c0_g1_i1:310-1311(-)